MDRNHLSDFNTGPPKSFIKADQVFSEEISYKAKVYDTRRTNGMASACWLTASGVKTINVIYIVPKP